MDGQNFNKNQESETHVHAANITREEKQPNIEMNIRDQDAYSLVSLNAYDSALKDEDYNKEKYSCENCRKYKKKCSKEIPACDRCRAKGLENECFYPGKSRRRTKAEMEVAKQHRDKILYENISRSNSLEEGSIYKEKVENTTKEQDVLKIALKATAKKQPDFAKEKGLMASPVSALPTINHSSTNAVYSAAPLLVEANNLTNSNFHSALNSGTFSMHHSGFADSDTHEINNFPENSPFLTTTQNNNLVDVSNPDAMSITAENIQYEAVAYIFKGGQPNPIRRYKLTKKFVKMAICAYFRHNHRIYPMINKLKFNEQVSQISKFEELENITDNDEDEIFKFMLYCILAIGSTTLQRAGSLEDKLIGVDEYLAYLAMKRFRIVMKYQTLDTIRCLILLGVYSFFEPKGISSWTIGGIICRLCIGLGLNKQLVGKKKRKFTEEELELRNRCYWSAYSFEKLVHLSLLRGDGGLEINDSDVPFPKPLYPEENDDIKINIMMIKIRALENKIFQTLHTIRAGKMFKNASLDERLTVINQLQRELDQTFQNYKNDFTKYNSENTPTNADVCGDVSFHRSELWLIMRYEQFQILLYRPSKVLPRLPPEILTKLGKVCLSSLRHSYMLYQQKKMPFNWVTLFRTLNVCNATCVCIYNWSIDLNDCEREFKQIIEVLSNFGSKWHAAKNFAKVFENISQSLLQFSFRANENNKDELQNLNFELFGPNSEYFDIMDENDVDISWLDFIK